MISALQMPESNQIYRTDLVKAMEKLGKVLKELEIRSLVEHMVQKNSDDMYVLVVTL